ncbi:MAG TPA: hypothetical protein ENN75_02465, partial [candidate division Zixibacteria bacterium]|nr:hypothetical protein [candidate division Zixibacteria bacterium]
MHITIENNTVVVNLDETEFPLFEAMFANLKLEKKVSVEMRKFPNIGGQFSWNLLPMHLCRTIGEANLSADPFATVSLYPFWKYGSAWPTAEGSDQTILPSYTYFCGSSQASSLSAEFTWENSSTTERIGRSPLSTNASGARRFEAKGTTGTASALTQSLKEGKYQAFALDAQSPIKHRVVVGTALG